MLGWIFTIVLLIVYTGEPVSAARPELLIAAALFAVAGSFGAGLNTIGSKLKDHSEKESDEKEA